MTVGYLKVQKSLLTSFPLLSANNNLYVEGIKSLLEITLRSMVGGGGATTATNLFWDNQTHRKSALPTTHSQEMMLLAPILCKANDSSRGTSMPGELVFYQPDGAASVPRETHGVKDKAAGCQLGKYTLSSVERKRFVKGDAVFHYCIEWESTLKDFC